MYGISPSSLTYELTPCVLPDYEDGILNKEERFISICRDWFKEDICGGSDKDYGFCWKRYESSIPGEQMVRVFTLEEQCRIWMAQSTHGKIADYFEKEHPVLEKVRMTLWHHYFHRDYFTFAKVVNGLKKLTWEGGEVRLVWTSKYRCDGPVSYDLTKDIFWLDNDFGAMIYIGGKHVLTIGFGAGPDGIYLSQVQLRNKKGNRFLFKLPCHYVDMAIDMLVKAFDMPIWIIDGKSAVACVRRSYGKAPCSLTSEDELRIAGLYDRNLDKYVRTDSIKNNADRRKHVLLKERKNAESSCTLSH
jgi:hypothetical protein